MAGGATDKYSKLQQIVNCQGIGLGGGRGGRWYNTMYFVTIYKWQHLSMKFCFSPVSVNVLRSSTLRHTTHGFAKSFNLDDCDVPSMHVGDNGKSWISCSLMTPSGRTCRTEPSRPPIPSRPKRHFCAVHNGKTTHTHNRIKPKKR